MRWGLFAAVVVLSGCTFPASYDHPTAQSGLQTLGSIFTLGAIPLPKSTPPVQQAPVYVAPTQATATPYAPDSTPSASSQWHDALYNCADCSPLERTQRYKDSLTCSDAAYQGSSILQFERQRISHGEKPEVAARAADESMGYPDIAVLAMGAPSAMSPQEFSNRVMKACLAAIDR
jgi:hypothetical protein